MKTDRKYGLIIEGLAAADSPDAFQQALAANKALLDDVAAFCDRNGIHHTLDAITPEISGVTFRGERAAQGMANFFSSEKVIDTDGMIVAPSPAPEIRRPAPRAPRMTNG